MSTATIDAVGVPVVGPSPAEHVGGVAERRRRRVRDGRGHPAEHDAPGRPGVYTSTASVAEPSGLEPPAITSRPPTAVTAA